jgi:hypothetical protein
MESVTGLSPGGADYVELLEAAGLDFREITEFRFHFGR